MKAASRPSSTASPRRARAPGLSGSPTTGAAHLLRRRTGLHAAPEGHAAVLEVRLLLLARRIPAFERIRLRVVDALVEQLSLVGVGVQIVAVLDRRVTSRVALRDVRIELIHEGLAAALPVGTALLDAGVVLVAARVLRDLEVLATI